MIQESIDLIGASARLEQIRRDGVTVPRLTYSDLHGIARGKDVPLMRPRIGITAWLRRFSTMLGEQKEFFTIGREYVDSIVAAGGAPILLLRAEDVDEVLPLIDGLLLSGGGDVHPGAYGDAHDGTSTEVDPHADAWEIALVRAASERRLPTLGICRGMQVMAVAFGGRLVQDVTTLAAHPDISVMTPEAILAQRHPVTLEPGCLVASIYGETRCMVNSIHHQAVADAGTLRVVGYGPDGVIEALESGNGWPAIGVQWHPEKMHEPVERRIFDHFIADARAFAARRQQRDAAAGVAAAPD